MNRPTAPLDRSLAGKVAIVTGAGSYHNDPELPAPGSGSAVAARLAELGAAVVLADINGEAAEKRAAEIRDAGGSATAIQVDVREEPQVEAMIAAALTEFGRLDVLHNNAHDSYLLWDPGDPQITEFSVETWRTLFEILVLGAMLGCKHAIPAMLRTGGGSIICTTSVSGEMGELNLTVYGAAKAAVNQLVRSVSAQWGKDGIRCNAVAPGLILSPPALAVGEEIIGLYARHSDTPYVGEPADVAELVSFLASDASRYITGQTIRIDGGLQQHSPLLADSRASGMVAGEQR